MRAYIHGRGNVYLPIELWDRVLAEATAFTFDDKLDDPFVLSHRAISTRTRKSVMLVSRDFYRMASRHVYEDLRIQERHFLDEIVYDEYLQRAGCKAVSRLRRLASTIRTRTQERTLSLRQTQSLVFHPNHKHDEMEKAGMDLCFILSHCSRITTFGTNMNPDYAPWLDVLVHTSSRTLTHLDIDIDHAYGRDPALLEGINHLQNLVWLRISDLAEWGQGNWHGMDHLVPLNLLPVLTLPSLRFLEAISSKEGRSDRIPFHIAAHAILPCLTGLRIRGHAAYGYDGTPILAQLGAKLEELHITLPDEHILERIHTLAPRLRDLTFIIGSHRVVEDPGDNSTCVLKHPTLRRLTLHGHFVFEHIFLSLQRVDVPQLEHLRLHDVRWHSWRGLEPVQERFWSVETCVKAAVKLAARGILVLDADGMPFGGLSTPGVGECATKNRTD